MTFRAPLIIGIARARFAAPAEYVVNLLPLRPVVVVTRFFHQDDWPSVARIPAAQKSDVYAAVAPLYSPNPAQPFAQFDWPTLRLTQKIKTDDFVNLLPFRTVVVVQNPFYQTDWPSAFRAAPAQKSDIYAATAPLYSPNPTQPFVQSDWFQNRLTQKARVDDPLAPPPLYSPNPARPFTQNDWLRASGVLKAKVDDVVNLAPIQSVVVVVSPPFVQSDWPLTATIRLQASDASLAALLSSYAPNPTEPFSQGDWLRPQGAIVGSDKGLSFGLNLNFPPPSPPPTTLTKLFTVSGPSVSDIFPTIVGVVYHTINPDLPFETVSRRTGTSSTIANGYVAEDGTTFYVAEDGTTFYVQE